MHSLLLEGSFRLFGLNPFGLRFLAMLSGTPIVGYTYVMMRVARFSVTPILASAFVLATSWTMTGFSKCMTLEPTLLHFYALSLLLAFVAESRLRGASMVYWSSCVAMGLGTLCKTSGVPMALACLPFLLFGVVVGRQRMLWRWRIAGTSAYSLGFAMTVAAGFWRWILPDLDSFYTLTVRTAFLERA
ncbi:MAG: glycosyltransferase family 39 protein [Candidatus Hydrogenedentes bacterium]|nr:glycosyltransferase family 39 protein [Candidatus Hydrogenedentota bacterium]